MDINGHPADSGCAPVIAVGSGEGARGKESFLARNEGSFPKHALIGSPWQQFVAGDVAVTVEVSGGLEDSVSIAIDALSLLQQTHLDQGSAVPVCHVAIADQIHRRA